MKTAILGYGTVGRGIEKILKQADPDSLKKILVRHKDAPSPLFTDSIDEILNDPGIDTVFECLSGLQPADTWIRRALSSGKNVISSNKEVLSANLDDYLRLAKENHVRIAFEAAAAGGIPFFHTLAMISRTDHVTGFEGIFNGTTNYILDSMQEHDTSYTDALTAAQKAGYAEKDPAADVSGMDVWYKMRLANKAAYHSYLSDFPKPEGITKITAQDITFAKKHHAAIRLLGISICEGKSFCSLIAPCFLPENSYFASVPLNYNAQRIASAQLGVTGLFGAGAGQMPTANAMVQDHMDLKNGHGALLECENTLQYDPSLIKADYLVRSRIRPADSEELGGGYYLFKQRDASVMEELKELREKDPDLMFGLWRIEK